MKIVGISGGSGAGKSTVSKGLAKMLPNAVFIDADPFFREATEKLEEEVFERIGMVKEEGVLNQNYFFASQDAMNGWIEVIKDYVSNRIEEAVAKLGAGKDFVIVDWCYLPMCDYFFNCDLTLCVKADYNTRYERLANRMKAVKSYSVAKGPSYFEYQKIPFENRVKYSAIDDFGYESEYVVVNDSDIESLNQTVRKIADNLIEMSDPRRRITAVKKSNYIPQFARQVLKKPIVQTKKGVAIQSSDSGRVILPSQTRGVVGQVFECR